jgi:hypothetical protein
MGLQRPEKIILAMNTLSGATSKPLRYEDIVVKAFEMFPEDFALRGFPKYPDSSDIHKPLYGPLKRAGYVLAGNKQFRLTQKGLERAKELVSTKDKRDPKSGIRLTRDKEMELQRIYQTDAFKLFLENKKEDILDTDFYSYLGVTVRIGKNEFLGRLNTVGDAVEAAAEVLGDPPPRKALELHRFLVAKFSAQIERVKSGK